MTSINPTVIGITSVHGHRIVSAEMTITIVMTTDTEPTTEGDQTMVVTDIAMTTIEQTMITTGMMTPGMTCTKHGIHETINITLIEVCETIDDTMTIIAENLLNPNYVALFPTMSRKNASRKAFLTPRLHPPP